jgi:U3 small nucleolar RNA-associated protein 18
MSAWHDEADETEIRGLQHASSTAVPTWAETAAEELEEPAAAARKRGRDATRRGDDGGKALRAILSRTAPVLSSKHQRKKAVPPTPDSTLFLPKDNVQDLAWHPSGEALVVTTSRGVDVYHCSGKYTEKVSSTFIKGRRLTQSALVPGGESVIALSDRTYAPNHVQLATGAVTPLTFLDVRIGATYVVGAKGKKVDEFPGQIVMKPNDPVRQQLAMPLGSRIVLASLSEGCVTHNITTAGPVNDLIYTTENEIACAIGNRVVYYDVRKTGKFLRQFDDEGSLQVTRLARHASVLAVGSSSGVVNLYVGDATKPNKSMMNLSTAADLLVCGETSGGSALIMGSSQQANGFRFVNLASMTVAASFPEVGMKHGFAQCMAFNPAAPIFTVGEKSRIVNYKC